MTQQKYLSQLEYETQKKQLLKLKQDDASLEAQRSTLLQQQATLQLTLKRIPLELEQSIQEILLQISAKKEQLARLSGESEVLITASKAGHITALDIKSGQLLKPQQYMFSILPNNMELYAELMIPTRAFGFVEQGQTTHIKMDAFPYQKFGIVKGTIVETSEFALLAKEIDLPIDLKEPMYKVKAKLDRQTMLAYGKSMPLQAGMLLNADVLVDKRSLIEWLF